MEAERRNPMVVALGASLVVVSALEMSTVLQEGGFSVSRPDSGSVAGATTAGLVVGGVQALALATAAFLVMRVLKLKDRRTLLSRRSKPVPRLIVWSGICCGFVSVGFGIASLELVVGEHEVPLSVLACVGIVLGVLCTGFFSLVRLIDIEVHKPEDSPIDSLTLYYLRCLCWDERTRRAFVVCTPVYLATVIGIVLTALHWSDSEGGVVCRNERRGYLLAATVLLGSHASLMSFIIRFKCRSRFASQVVLFYMIATSLGWGISGGSALQRSECRTAPEPATMHVLLVIFGFGLLITSLACNVEATLTEYDIFHQTTMHDRNVFVIDEGDEEEEENEDQNLVFIGHDTSMEDIIFG